MLARPTGSGPRPSPSNARSILQSVQIQDVHGVARPNASECLESLPKGAKRQRGDIYGGHPCKRPKASSSEDGEYPLSNGIVNEAYVPSYIALGVSRISLADVAEASSLEHPRHARTPGGHQVLGSSRFLCGTCSTYHLRRISCSFNSL